MKKISNKFYLFAIIFCLIFSISCSLFNGSRESKTETAEVSFDDNYKTDKEGEIVIDDTVLNNKQVSAENFGKSRQEITKVLNDNSNLTTMYDGYGNKVETRYFARHPNIDCLVITTFADGRQEIIVYGQNGEYKTLPQEMAAKALSASGNEIAQMSGIYDVEGDRQAFGATIVQENLSQQSYAPVKMREFPEYTEPAAQEAPIATAPVEEEQKQAAKEIEKSEEKPQTAKNNLEKGPKPPEVP